MNPEQKTRWLAHIDASITKRELTIEQTRQARNSADSPMTSRYDTQRDIFNNDLNIQLDGLEADKRLQQEIAESGERNRIESGAYIEIEIEGEVENYLFTNSYGSLPDTDIITPMSPIGKALFGKNAGEKAEYRVREETIVIDIKKIQ